MRLIIELDDKTKPYHYETEANSHNLNLFRKLITNTLVELYGTEEDVYKQLKSIITLHFDEVVELYEAEDDTMISKINRILDQLERKNRNMFFNTVIEASNKNNTYIGHIYAILFALDNSKNPLKSMKIVPELSAPFVLDAFYDAFEKNLIPKEYFKMSDCLLQEKPKMKETELWTFLKDFKNKKINKIVIEDNDQFTDQFELYKKVKNIDYKKIIYSPEFIKYTEDCSSSDFEHINDLIEEYLMETDQVFFPLEIADVAINNKDKYKANLMDEDRIKNISFMPNGFSFFDVLESNTDAINELTEL